MGQVRVGEHDLVDGESDECEPVVLNAEDPLYILYTSGTTGKPKGIVHSQAGYLTGISTTHDYVFDIKPDSDVYWCAADIGWVTGHSYIVYGPLANGATTLMFEGVPNYPDASRLWQVVDKHQVNIVYTAPTAIRALMGAGDDWVTKTSRKSLRLLGTVGEPINPEAWDWYHRVVGEGRCPIVDTWWQTETGACMMTPLPGAHALKPGAAAKPFFGVNPQIVDAEGTRVGTHTGYAHYTVGQRHGLGLALGYPGKDRLLQLRERRGRGLVRMPQLRAAPEPRVDDYRGVRLSPDALARWHLPDDAVARRDEAQSRVQSLPAVVVLIDGIEDAARAIADDEVCVEVVRTQVDAESITRARREAVEVEAAVHAPRRVLFGQAGADRHAELQRSAFLLPGGSRHWRRCGRLG